MKRHPVRDDRRGAMTLGPSRKGKITFWRDLAETCGPFLKLLGGNLDFRRDGADVMEPGKGQASEINEGESRALVHAGPPSTDVEIAPLVQEVGATSIAGIEKMIGELQQAKDFLQSEGERLQRETEHYTTLAQMASASVQIISHTVAGWREAGHPLPNRSRSSHLDLTTCPAEDNAASAHVPDQPPQSQGQIRARTGRKSP
jgi:hypothetical protein